MVFADYVILAVILLVVSLGIWVIHRSKKKGKCVGCPDRCACSAANCGHSGNCAGCAHKDS